MALDKWPEEGKTTFSKFCGREGIEEKYRKQETDVTTRVPYPEYFLCYYLEKCSWKKDKFFHLKKTRPKPVVDAHCRFCRYRDSFMILLVTATGLFFSLMRCNSFSGRRDRGNFTVRELLAKTNVMVS